MNPWGESINDKGAYWLRARLESPRICQCSRQKKYVHHERCLQCENEGDLELSEYLDVILDEIGEILEEDTVEFVENYYHGGCGSCGGSGE